MNTSAPVDPFWFPAHEEQKPTHSRIHIQTAEEAHRVFECVRTGILRPVIRRLNDAERAMYIRSGSVFVWEETEEAIGLRRWTDGLMWSASRMREPFLFYESKSRGRNNDNGDTSNDNRSSTDSDRPSSTPESSLSLFLQPHQSRGPRPNYNEVVPGLVKQTYSAIVTPGDGTKRKWHLTAYFTNADFPNLPTVADDPVLNNVVVPKGVYRSGKSRQSAKSLQAELGGSPPPTSVPRPSNSAPDLTSAVRPNPSGQHSNPASAVKLPPEWSSGYGNDRSYPSSPSSSPTTEYPPRRIGSSSGHRRPYSCSSPSSPSTPSNSRPSTSSQRGNSNDGRLSYSPSSYFSSGPTTPQPHPSHIPPYQPPAPHQPQYNAYIPISTHESPVLPPLGPTYADQRYVLPPGRSHQQQRPVEDQRMLQMFKGMP